MKTLLLRCVINNKSGLRKVGSVQFAIRNSQFAISPSGWRKLRN